MFFDQKDNEQKMFELNPSQKEIELKVFKDTVRARLASIENELGGIEVRLHNQNNESVKTQYMLSELAKVVGVKWIKIAEEGWVKFRQDKVKVK
jgi:hypothetical protein